MGAQVSGADGCAQIQPELGVYVLGAISPADRTEVDRHLVSCPRCRDEVAGLAGIPALLHRVPVAAVAELSGQHADSDDPGPQAGLLDGLLRRVAALRRQRRRRLVAAGAILAAAAAAGWVPHLLHPAAPPLHATTWWTAAALGLDPATSAGATVRYAPEPWGTKLEAATTGIASGTTCQIWAITASGQHAAAGGWTVTGDDLHAWYYASVPFPAATLAGFDITAGGKVLVTIPLRR